MNTKKLLTRVAVTSGLFVGAFVLSTWAAWQTAPSTPPTCNPSYDGCNAPLNAGANSQYKSGSVGLGATSGLKSGEMLHVFGAGTVDNLFAGTLTLANGAGTNKILVSDASGKASWQTLDIATPVRITCEKTWTTSVSGQGWSSYGWQSGDCVDSTGNYRLPSSAAGCTGAISSYASWSDNYAVQSKDPGGTLLWGYNGETTGTATYGGISVYRGADISKNSIYGRVLYWCNY